MKRRHILLSGVLLIATIAGGCSQREHEGQSPARDGAPAYTTKEATALGGADLAMEEGRSDSPVPTAYKVDLQPAGAGEKVKGAAPRQGEPNLQLPTDRKIIFTADILLKVADFSKADVELQQFVQVNQGFAAQADVSGSAGGKRLGTWKVRVPVTHFVEFCEAVKKLGELVRYTSGAKEVTEEYFDLQTRAKNKEAELETLRKIFDKADGKIDQVLMVQRELSRAQGELEQMKGRQRVLENLTELTTVTIHIGENLTYLPPTPLPPATFGTTVSQAFFGSIDVLIGVGKAVVVAAAAAAPWLPLVAVFSAVIWLIVRQRRIAMRLAQSDPAVVANP
jgi:hypothetical protein